MASSIFKPMCVYACSAAWSFNNGLLLQSQLLAHPLPFPFTFLAKVDPPTTMIQRTDATFTSPKVFRAHKRNERRFNLVCVCPATEGRAWEKGWLGTHASQQPAERHTREVHLKRHKSWILYRIPSWVRWVSCSWLVSPYRWDDAWEWAHYQFEDIYYLWVWWAYKDITCF